MFYLHNGYVAGVFHFAKMKYFVLMGNYFLPHKQVITSVQLKQRLQEIQAAFSFEVLHLFGKSGSLTNGRPREMAVREVDVSTCSIKSGER